MTAIPPPQTFAEALGWVKGCILADFDREIAQKQLYYHNREHANTVCRRAKLSSTAHRYAKEEPCPV